MHNFRCLLHEEAASKPLVLDQGIDHAGSKFCATLRDNFLPATRLPTNGQRYQIRRMFPGAKPAVELPTIEFCPFE